MKEGWWGEPPPQTPGLCLALDWATPFAVFQHFSRTPYVAFLDSRGADGPRSRYSYIGVDPFLVLRSVNGVLHANGTRIEADPFTAVEQALRRYATPNIRAPVPFGGGAIGFFGYGLGSILEHVRPAGGEALDFPDMCVGFYDLVFAFDHDREQAWLMSSGLPELQHAARAERASLRLKSATTKLSQPVHMPLEHDKNLIWHADTPRNLHTARVARVRNLIEAGDLYQANITARFQTSRPPGLSGADIFALVRENNPAPFTAFLDCGEATAIVSASPERALRLHAGGRIEARPIKGSRPRGETAADDAAMRSALLHSAKDRAENLMIVDLLRHDIGRVAVFGSVDVPELCHVESFANIHHLVSVVEGTLRPGLGAIDLLRAAFPGGSVTGAPKIRAMQVIAELEGCPRGPYCGMAAWIGFDGAMDSSILIRTLVVTAHGIAVNAGGGIVADSDPEEEFDEMMVKVAPLLRSLGKLAA